MKQTFLHLWVLLSLILVAACAESDEPDVVTQFFVAPQNLSPEKIKVDFDGDGTPDKILLTGLKGSASELSRSKTLLHPWIFDKQSIKSSDLATGSKNNFYIVLSGSKAGYVINDANPISILDTEAAQELFTVTKNAIADMGLDEITGKAKGDLLGIPTEAGIDTYLYWNGITFVSYEPLEVP